VVDLWDKLHTPTNRSNSTEYGGRERYVGLLLYYHSVLLYGEPEVGCRELKSSEEKSYKPTYVVFKESVWVVMKCDKSYVV
jgi:hypothetical protein